MTADPPVRQGVRRVVPMGERALLAETDGIEATLTLFEHLTRHPLRHQTGLVPGARSVLIRFSGAVSPSDVLGGSGVAPAPDPHPDPLQVRIDVVYDAADLQEVGALTGLGADGVIDAHTGTAWRVAFCGFSPGFGYLTGGDPRLIVPRRDTPRERVPAGAVGLAGEYSGVYPGSSPGGWRLIGRTGAVLWDPRRDPPALLRPGMTVRFRAVRESVTANPPSREPDHPAPAVESGRPAPAGDADHPASTGESGRADPTAESGRPAPAAPPRGRGLAVLRPGIQCTVQDLGRPGLTDMGVSPSGAADRGAAMRANRIVGNDVGAAVLEIVLGGAEFRAEADLLVAVTGAPVDLQVRDARGIRPAGTDRPVPVPAGASVRLGRPARGLRSYLAVRGGIDVPPVLGSRSTDVLAGIGPPPPRRGDVLPVGDEHWGMPHPLPAAAVPEVPELELRPGPQADWFADSALRALCSADWTVSPASNRVGIRLTGPGPRRIVDGELRSQGLVRGALQVPPSGELVIFLADHPVTGGYPVIAVLTEPTVDLAAQARPGGTVRFRLL